MTSDLQRDLARTLGNQYAIDRELGGGGTWRTFLARDRTLYRDVVVKVLSPQRSEGVSAERFIEQIRRASVLQEPHIVPLLVAGSISSGVPYYSMPFVGELTLASRLAQGRVPLEAATAIARDVAAALAFAHARGLVHLNLTADDVLLVGDSAMVKDFGVTAALNAARAASTDRVPREPVDPRADVLAWGALAYELLAGAPPFSQRAFTPGGSAALADPSADGSTPVSLRDRAPSVPTPIAQLVMSCLATDPARRPKDARDIISAFTVSTNTVVTTKPPTRSRRTPLLIAGAAVVLIGGAYALLRPRGTVSASSGAAAGLHTLALLPMSDANNDPDRVYFTSGLTDDVTKLVTQLPTLRVAPRSATARIRAGDEFDPLALGTRLGVESVLETRLRRDGRRLQLTAVLTRVADGTLLFRESFTRDEGEVLRLEDDIARAVALSFRVGDKGGSTSAASRTRNLEAYDLVLRARYESRTFSDSAVRSGIKLYERAVALDPNYLDAWNGLADCWRRLADDFMPARTAMASGKTAIARSWALDSTSSAALATRAIDEFLHERNLAAAERDFSRALRIDSTSTMSPLYADLLLQLGKTDSAIAVMGRAARLEPTSPVVARYGPPLLAGVDRMEALRNVCTRAVEVDSASYTFDCLRMELRVSGQWRAYLATCDSVDHACRGVALHRLDRQDEARREAAALEVALRKTAGSRYLDPGLIAIWYAQMGDVDRVLSQLELALAVDSKYVAHLRDPFFFSEVRGDPRFQAFIRRAGLL